MPPAEEPVCQTRRRERATEAASIPDPPDQPPANRRKRPRPRRFKTPPQFWDTLSRLWLTRLALREFDRRTVRPVAPKSPERCEVKGDLAKELRRFARHGGPNLRDLRGYPEPGTRPASVHAMSSSQSHSSQSRVWSGADPSGASTLPAAKMKPSKPKDANFEQKCIDYDIYPYNRGPRPNKWDELKNRLAQPRASLSASQFSEEAFEDFQRKNDEAQSEDQVKSDVMPIIRGEAVIPSIHNRAFKNLATMTDGMTVQPKPDYYDGSRPSELDRRVREELSPYIMPSKRTHEPLLPNFFTEVKGPDGNAAELKRQVTYDAAHGARAMLETRRYAQNGYTYDDNAYTLVSSYHSGTGTLNMYAMHPTEPVESGGRPQYRMTQINAWALTGNPDTCRDGLRAYRNGRVLAMEYRDAAIASANEKAKEIYGGAAPPALLVKLLP